MCEAKVAVVEVAVQCLLTVQNAQLPLGHDKILWDHLTAP